MYAWCLNLWGKIFSPVSDNIPVHLSFFFHSPRWRFVLQTEISGKYNLPLYSCFLSLFYLSLFLPWGSVYCFQFKIWYSRFYWSRFTKGPADLLECVVVVLRPSEVFLIPGGYTLCKLYRCVPQVVWFFSRFGLMKTDFVPIRVSKREPFSMEQQEFINLFLPKNLWIKLGF